MGKARRTSKKTLNCLSFQEHVQCWVQVKSLLLHYWKETLKLRQNVFVKGERRLGIVKRKKGDLVPNLKQVTKRNQAKVGDNYLLMQLVLFQSCFQHPFPVEWETTFPVLLTDGNVDSGKKIGFICLVIT